MCPLSTTVVVDAPGACDLPSHQLLTRLTVTAAVRFAFCSCDKQLGEESFLLLLTGYIVYHQGKPRQEPGPETTERTAC